MASGIEERITFTIKGREYAAEIEDTARYWRGEIEAALKKPLDAPEEYMAAALLVDDMLIHAASTLSLRAIDSTQKVHAIALFRFCEVPPTGEKGMNTMSVVALLVAPEHLDVKRKGRSGLGRAMMSELYKAAKKTVRIQAMLLYSAESAVGFYRKIGMKMLNPALNFFVTEVTAQNPFLQDEKRSDRDTEKRSDFTEPLFKK